MTTAKANSIASSCGAVSLFQCRHFSPPTFGRSTAAAFYSRRFLTRSSRSLVRSSVGLRGKNDGTNGRRRESEPKLPSSLCTSHDASSNFAVQRLKYSSSSFSVVALRGHFRLECGLHSSFLPAASRPAGQWLVLTGFEGQEEQGTGRNIL